MFSWLLKESQKKQSFRDYLWKSGYGGAFQWWFRRKAYGE